MTAHHGGLPGAKPVPPPAVYPAKHPLPASNLPEFAGDVIVFTPSAAQLDRLIAIASADLAALASRDAVARVVTHNPDTLWGISRKASYRAEDQIAEGFIAFLMLNTEGLRSLVEGTFDASDPDLDLLCGQHQRPAGIYVWAMWARNNLVAGIPLATDFHGHGLFAQHRMIEAHRVDHLQPLGGHDAKAASAHLHHDRLANF